MTATFYIYNSERNKINKTLSNGIEKNIIIKNSPSNLSNLIITITEKNFFYSNYVYIKELNRYYFVTDINENYNDTKILFLEIDVLMSFKEDILKSNILLKKSSEKIDSDFLDYEQSVKPTFLNYSMDSPFIDDKQIVMITE